MQPLKLTAACVFVNTRAGQRQREGMGPVGHRDDAFYCTRGRWHLDRIASEELAPTYSGGEHDPEHTITHPDDIFLAV